MKISEAFDMYIQEYLILKSGSEGTIEHYQKYKKSLCECLGDIRLEEVDLEAISKWNNALLKGRSGNTVREYLCGLRMLLKYCSLRGFDCLNYGLVPVPKRTPVIPTFLTKEEVSLMIDNACNARSAFVVSLLYSSGIRLSEMLALNRGQIVNRKFTVVGKGKKPRLCFIDKRTEDLMNEYLKARTDKNNALVVSKDKKRMTATNVQLLVSNAARNAGLAHKHIHPHTLRHSFATNFLENNGNMRYLSTLMGHANLNTTAMYAHVVDVDLENQYKRFHSI